jgi:hypothetical protein
MHSQDAGGNMYLDMVTSEEGQPKKNKNKNNTEQNREQKQQKVETEDSFSSFISPR